MNTTPQHNPTKIPETPIVSIISSVPESTIRDTSGRIMSLLPLEDKQNLLNTQNQFNELIEQLEIEVKRISDEIWYDYDSGTYIKKLSINKDATNIVIHDLFTKYPTLKDLYNQLELSPLSSQSKELVLDMIFSNYLEDLAYEFVDTSFCPDWKESVFRYEGSFYDYLKPEWEFDKAINNHNKWTELFHLSLVSQMFIPMKLEQFERLFWLFSELKSVDFRGSYFRNMWPEKQKFISKQLFWVKCFWVGGADLIMCNLDTIKAIFCNLEKVKFIDLNESKFEQLDISILRAIFSSLHPYNIDLSNNNLFQLDYEQLDIVFQNACNLRSIGLSQCAIWIMDKEQLQFIFSRLRNVSKINLSYNRLNELNKECLAVIFSNLPNAKLITLDWNKFSNQIKHFIKTLVPNAEVTFKYTF